MESEPSDSELVARAQQGSHDAFRELVSRHKNYVFGLIGRQVGRRDVAEELCQDAFVKAFRALARFRGDASFRTWITRIALNTTHSHFASKRYASERASVSLEHAAEEAHEDPDPVVARELMTRFRDCLKKLKGDLREVVSLCGFEEQSYEDVAAALSIPVGTVRSRLNRARLTLRECVERGGEKV